MKEIDFSIEIIADACPIYIPPYRAPTELKEFARCWIRS